MRQPLYFYRKHSRNKSHFNKTKVSGTLVREHKGLFLENIEDVVSLWEKKYWDQKDLYTTLDLAFLDLTERHEKALKELSKYKFSTKHKIRSIIGDMLDRLKTHSAASGENH